MRILIIASFADSLVNFRGELIKRFIADGYEVHLAAPEIFKSTKLQTLLNEGAIAHDIPMQRTGLNPLQDLKTLYAIWHLCKKIKPEYTLAYTVKPVVYGMLAGYLARVPKRYAMITGLGYAFQEDSKGLPVRKVARLMYKISLATTHGVMFQNPDDLALFKNEQIISKNKVSSIINGSGVDMQYFAQQKLPDSLSCLLIARLLVDKGVREYAQAAKILKAKYPQVSFKLAGWIDENPSAIKQTELDSWIEQGHITFLGKLSDVRPALNECSVFVLPSYREGTPRTVLEAMSVGRSIVTTNAPGCKETVREGYNGFLVDVKDSAGLAQAIEKLIVDSALREKMAQNARQLAEEKYDVHKVNNQMLLAMGILGK